MALVLTFLRILSTLLAVNQCFAEIRVPVERRHNQGKFGDSIKRFHPDAKFLQLKNTKSLAVSSNSSDNLYDYTELIYVARVGLGTPPQYFEMVMDTGSSDLWVPATACGDTCTDCTGIQQCVPKTEFDPTKSSTFVNRGNTFSLTYGKGSCDGTTATDTMTLGDASVTNQTIGDVSSIATAFMQQHMNGILGLGYQNLASFTNPIPLLSMVKQGVIDKPIFSVFMERVGSGNAKEHVGGEIVFGSNPDNSKYSGSIYYQKVTNPKYWMMSMDGYSVGGGGKVTTKYPNVISDTGTSFLIGPLEDVQDIVNKLDVDAVQQGIILMKCSKRSSAPSIKLYFGGKPFEITANDYLIDIGVGSGFCVVAMQAGQISSEVDWILGDTWIRAWYHVYDMENNRIGLARAGSHDGVAKVVPSGIVMIAMIVTAAVGVWSSQ